MSDDEAREPTDREMLDAIKVVASLPGQAQEVARFWYWLTVAAASIAAAALTVLLMLWWSPSKTSVSGFEFTYGARGPWLCTRIESSPDDLPAYACDVRRDR